MLKDGKDTFLFTRKITNLTHDSNNTNIFYKT